MGARNWHLNRQSVQATRMLRLLMPMLLGRWLLRRTLDPRPFRPGQSEESSKREGTAKRWRGKKTGRSTTSASWANDCFRMVMSYPRSTDEAALTTGDSWSTRYKPFIHHLRQTLIAIGMPEARAQRYAGHSMRSGGATSEAAHGLSPAGRDVPACRRFEY